MKSIINPIIDLRRYFFAKLFPSLIGLVSSIYFIRVLNVEQFGIYQIIISTLLLIGSIGFSWINSIVIRYYSILGEVKLISRTTLLLTLSLILSLFVWFITYSINHYDSALIFYSGLVWLIGYGIYEYLISLKRAKNDYNKYQIITFLKSLFGLILATVLMYSFGLNGIYIITGQGLVMILSSGYIFPSERPKKIKDFILPDRDMISFGLPGIFINIITILSSVSGKFLINHRTDINKTAIYSANFDFSEKTIFFINALFILSSSASAIKIFEENDESANEYLEQILKLYITFVPFLLLILSTLYPLFLRNFLNEEYYQGIYIYPLIGAGALVTGIIHRYSLVLTFHKKTLLNFIAIFCSIFINIVFTYIFIPVHGILTPAIGFILSQLVYLIFVLYFSRGYLTPKFPTYLTFRVLVFTSPILFFLIKVYTGVIPSNINVLITLLFVIYYIIIIHKTRTADIKGLIQRLVGKN